MQQVGLVGSGLMATTHAERYRSITEAEVVAVASLDDNLPEFVSQHAPKADAYRDAETMFDEADVSVVDLCTPTPTHQPLVEAAAKRGLGIFCEKPIARTMDGANAIVEAVHEADVPFMTGHVLRYFPEYETAKERIDRGEIGTPSILRTERLATPPTYGSDGWFADTDQSGGALLDLAIHDFDLLRWVAGEVDHVFARASTWNDDGVHREHAAVTLRFENGALGFVEVSWAYGDDAPFTMTYEFAGDEGLLEFDSRAESSLQLSSVGDNLDVPSATLQSDPYTRELRHFIDCAESGDEPAITPEDGREALRIALAAIESSETNKPVSVEEVGA